MRQRFDHRITILVVDSQKARAELLGHQLDPDGGEIFIVPLAPVGSPPGTIPTHWFAGWQLTTVAATALAARLGAESVAKPGRLREADTETTLTAAGLAVIPSAPLPITPGGR